MTLVLGIETSCDESGVALYRRGEGLVGHILHSQVRLHAAYGGVVPELASRDHIRRLPELFLTLLKQTGCRKADIDTIAYTQGPGLAGALLVGAGFAASLAYALGKPVLPIHHLEGHLLSPLLEEGAPDFPFVALLVSGGHSQLMTVHGVGDYRLLGETVDDAAGEAFDKSAQLLGLGYPGGARLAELAAQGRPGRLRLPRPMLNSGDFNFSFSGLKTAVRTAWLAGGKSDEERADIAAEFQEAITDVLAAKALGAVLASGLGRLVVAGGVGANRRLREKLLARAGNVEVHFPRLEFCTDNGAMIAYVGARRVMEGRRDYAFSVRPRWNLEELQPPCKS